MKLKTRSNPFSCTDKEASFNYQFYRRDEAFKLCVRKKNIFHRYSNGFELGIVIFFPFCIKIKTCLRFRMYNLNVTATIMEW